MTLKDLKPDRPINQPRDTSVPRVEEEACEVNTPNSYDPHITPAETAARKLNEGPKFKNLNPHPDGSDSIDEGKGFVVDKEGLVDNFAIEPEMYYEVHGDAEKKKPLGNNEQPDQPSLNN
jgi:hypothetical protein